MTKKDAYSEGYDNGYSAAQDGYKRADQSWDEYESDCFETEENARQFSPFEFTASEINQSRNSESLWEAYDRGVAKGIHDGVKERKSSGGENLLIH